MNENKAYTFSALDNFRDMGGISAAEGRKVMQGRLLRCGDLSNITEEDIRLLKDVFHVKNVVDLRTQNERLGSPDRMMEGAKYIALDFFPDELPGRETGSADQLKQMQNIAQVDKRMKELYVSFIEDTFVRKQLYDFLQLLLETKSGATVFHCFAGKDRTGITAAVILTILGVSREDITRDYLRTNELRKTANQSILARLEASGQPKEMREAVLTALSVKQSYLDVSYATAEQEYGSFENFILEGIGLKESDWKTMREMYLAG